MSLRDQLLAKGLVSKKRAKHIDRELKQERKKKQSSRKKKKHLERERQAAIEAERQAELARKQELRRKANEAREAAHLATRVRSLVLGNRIASRGTVPYWHRTVGGRELRRLSISEKVAWKLRAGEAAIAAIEKGIAGDVDYHVISASAARELLELAPERVVTFVRDTTGISQPDEAFLDADWEISLRPHRVEAG